jgi:thiol:disulfide interchange protein
MKLNRLITITLLALVALVVSLGVSSARAGEFPAGSPAFETKYAAAQAKAKASGKPLLLVFSATWCPPCQTNKKVVYPAAEVQPFHDKFVWAYLDADDQANVPAMQQFKVEGIPHIQFTDAGGRTLGSVVGGCTPAAFATKLTEILKAVPAAPVEAPK